MRLYLSPNDGKQEAGGEEGPAPGDEDVELVSDDEVRTLTGGAS